MWSHEVKAIANIKQSSLSPAYALFKDIYENEISLNANVTGQDSVNLGEFAKGLAKLEAADAPLEFKDRDGVTYLGREKICEFLNSKKNLDSLVAVIKDLNEHKDDSTITYTDTEGLEKTVPTVEALVNFLNLLYTAPPELPKPSAEAKVDDFAILYMGKAGELAAGFANTKTRDDFRYTVRPKESKDFIPVQFRKGTQYQYNPDGITPAIYGENSKVVYCPSYPAGGGEFAINLVTAGARERFIAELGIRADGPPIKVVDRAGGFQNKITYGGKLFTIFLTIPGETKCPPQDSAIYFSKDNPIFDSTKKGAHLKINRRTGEITQGVAELLPEPAKLDADLGYEAPKGRGKKAY